MGVLSAAVRILAASMVSALVGWFAVGSGPDLPFGGPADRPPRVLDPRGDLTQAPGIDVDHVVESVTHRVEPVDGDVGVLGAHDRAYRARFDPSGFALTSTARSDEAPTLAVSLTELRRGAVALPVVPQPWRADANAASRETGPGITERVTARRDEIEWDLVLARAPDGDGDFVAVAQVDGLVGRPTRHADGWRFPVAGREALRMGEVVIRDAHGTELQRGPAEVDGAEIRLRVSGSTLSRAVYPLTVDPVVRPETAVSGSPRVPSGEVPAVTFDGTNFLVVWQDDRLGEFDIFGARVTRDGAVLDPDGIRISTTTGADSGPAVAFDGTRSLVAWQSATGIRTTSITTAGEVLNPDGVLVTGAVGARAPSVASNGDTFLVVWEQGPFTSADIFGARVDGTGTVLEPGGFAVSTASGAQGAARATSNGSAYFVVWRDGRSASGDQVFGARVTSAGTVPEANGIAISGAQGGTEPAVASDGRGYLVVWSRFDESTIDSDIVAARLSSSGTVLDPGGFPITTSNSANANEVDPSVAFDSVTRRFLVVWSDLGEDIVATRVSRQGQVLDPDGIAVSTSAARRPENAPAAAFDEATGRFLVVWQGAIGNDAGIFAGRVDGAGTVLDPAGLAVSTIPQPVDFQRPAVAFDGSRFLVVWEAGTRIVAARVDPSGAVLDPAGIVIATSSPPFSIVAQPTVAFGGGTFLVAWQDLEPELSRAFISVRPVTTTGSVGVRRRIASTSPSFPAMAFAGTRFLVAWQRGPNPGDVVAARVNTDGTAVDSTAIPLSTGPAAETRPAVASDGTQFLVVWQDHRTGSSDVFGARVNTAGTVLDPSGIGISTLATGESAPAVGSDGTRFLVVWSDSRGGPARGSDIFAARVDASGTRLDSSGIPVSTESGDQDSPAVAANGPFLVAWRDRRSGTSFDIYAARVDAQGSVLDPAGFAISNLSTDEESPRVARSMSDDWAVTYDRFDTPSDADRIFLRTVSPK